MGFHPPLFVLQDMELDADGNKLIQKMKLGETQKVKTVSFSASSKVVSQARAGEGFDSLFVGGGVTPTLSALHRQQDQVVRWESFSFFRASLSFKNLFFLQAGGQDLTEEEVAKLDLELEMELDDVNAENID